jgi:glycosyltransferase involved in cell wall biosynthesis
MLEFSGSFPHRSFTANQEFYRLQSLPQTRFNYVWPARIGTLFCERPQLKDHITEPPSSEPIFLSIIIPAFNEEKIIEETLERIAFALSENQDEGFSWEIIVCDNNSTDRTAEFARRAGAKVVFEPINHIAQARNSGAGSARGEWLLFIDADTYPPPGLISDVLDLIRSGHYVGCSSTIKVDGGPFWYRINLEGHNIDMRLFKTCFGLFVLCQAEAFRAISGFNTNLYALEDLDFANRLKIYGKKLGRGFAIFHHHPVITSGRKGHLYSRWTMTKSGLIALWYLITKKKIGGANNLPFWYDGRR